MTEETIHNFIPDDITVRFYEDNGTGLVWEDYGTFGIPDVHRQVKSFIDHQLHNILCLAADIEISMCDVLNINF